MPLAHSRLRLAVALGLVTAACSGGHAELGGDDTPGDESELKAGDSLAINFDTKMPIGEISGLGRRTLGAQVSYLAVSDAEPTLLTFDVEPNGKPSSVTKHDLSGLLGDAPSQWEAVAGDGAGHVFILTEAISTISVLDPELNRVVHTIKLTLPEGHPLHHAWKADVNSLCEGMVLLANGHVLVVKEKDPVALVEFAPGGEAASGYRADLALGDGAFRLPPGSSSTMTAVHHWVLKSADAATVSDVSELALDVDGRLLLLSDQARSVVRIERELRPDEDKIDLKTIFALPDALDKPEGLVLASGMPLVAIDDKDRGRTLFTLTRMP
jgi:uncharacterized protein YjiK